ncbi:diaminopimelate decarboxylase [Alicyclobacillaceae bacterium I2511]|nr:diaminopimelate decarboxylase [Alicyclobacillaceae bacterium I2511]
MAGVHGTAQGPRHLWGTLEIDALGQLRLGGIPAQVLAERFLTPLMVYDEQLLRENMRAFHQALQQTGLKYDISYAAKAFCTLAMCKLADEEGLSLDVVSGGELYTALQAGVAGEKIHFHGNNKTPEELAFALESQVGVVIVDNFTELTLLEGMAAARGVFVNVLLRISPGVEAHTHEFIATGQQDSKFGFDLASGQARQAFRQVRHAPHLHCIGLHSHIGSQIFDSVGFVTAVERLSELYAQGVILGLPLRILNVGGGFGIRYTEDDTPMPMERQILAISAAVRRSFDALNLDLPELWVEPGRSIVGLAGTTLYRVGTQKVMPGVRNYVAVDGGMTDNPRLALYGSKYEAVLANRALDDACGDWTVAGKCCESGDVLIWDTPLPKPQPGDVVAVFATGAYNYSMASHYNRNPNPGVVFVRDGRVAVVVQRETWADVARLDLPLVYD